MNIQLYKLADEYLQAAELLSELDMPPEVVADTLESLQGDLEVKATNIAMLVKQLESTADAITEAEKAMAARRKAMVSRAAQIREYLLHNMQRTGISKIDSPYFSISIRKNPHKVEILQAGGVPDEFMRQQPAPPPEVDKKAVAEYIKAGNNPDWATLTQTDRVEIK